MAKIDDLVESIVDLAILKSNKDVEEKFLQANPTPDCIDYDPNILGACAEGTLSEEELKQYQDHFLVCERHCYCAVGDVIKALNNSEFHKFYKDTK